jgi:hypothetical protein
MTEPQADVPFEVYVHQAGKDVIAAEKLQALETKKDVGRAAPDRHRRDARATT